MHKLKEQAKLNVNEIEHHHHKDIHERTRKASTEVRNTKKKKKKRKKKEKNKAQKCHTWSCNILILQKAEEAFLVLQWRLCEHSPS